jgi:hypothetical protein
VWNFRQLAQRDEGDAGDGEPDDGGDELDDRFAAMGFKRRQADPHHAEDEAEPHQQLELLAEGGQELGPIARELLVPAVANLAHLDRDQDANRQRGNDRNELKHRVLRTVAILRRRLLAQCARCHTDPPKLCLVSHSCTRSQDSRAGFYELSNPGDPHTVELQMLSGLPYEAVDIAPQPYRVAFALDPHAAE